ncbi:MAG: Flp pilus assembly protein CpaB [Pseudonocardiales bacterium]|nr:MAG: Flp pilus assembly protein CpaB [Pseudonocardiales bacterium]
MSRSLSALLACLNRWPRRLAVLSCLLLAALSAVDAGGRSPGRERGPAVSTRVVVAARDLGVGATLDAHDLTIVTWPRELVPAGAWGQPDRLVGRRLAGPLRKREAVTTTRLVGSDLTAGLTHGEVATLVTTDAGFATLIHPGDRVDVLAGPPDDVQSASPGNTGAAKTLPILVAKAVTVLAVVPSTDTFGGSNSAQVLVATDRVTALRMVALRGRQVLAVTADPP